MTTMPTIPVIDSMPTLNPLLTSKISEVRQAAEQAANLSEQLKAGDLTQSEFDELIDDITRIEQINKDMFNLTVYMDIQKAFQIILTLKSIVTLL